MDKKLQRKNENKHTCHWQHFQSTWCDWKKKTINEYFDNLEKSLKIFVSLDKVDPSLLFNYDETNFTNDPGKLKVLVSKEYGRVENIQGGSKTTASIMVCGSADGTTHAPMIVYKVESLYIRVGHLEVLISQSILSANLDGSMLKAFFIWFKLSFIHHVKDLKGPKVLFGDNLSSHINKKVFDLANEHNVHFIFFSANATHLFQPLDVGVFAPLKPNGEKLLQIS